MSKQLVIVESPAKTRTLKKFLGSQFSVEASMGHIRDLPKKNMGLGPDLEPIYELIPEKAKMVKRLRQAAKKAEIVYLAPDPDREGEAIAWHIAQILEKDPAEIRRITFNEITRKAVLQALENPGEIDLRKVDAQQARRILDRLMGFRISPLLWDKVKKGLSAGRVQSVALKMVCQRQDEIDAFEPREYWNIGARLEGKEPPPFEARLSKIKGKKADVPDGETAKGVTEALNAGRFVVSSVSKKASRQHPKPPFITSRLQQEAARRFRFTVKRTMALAQALYEGKEIGEMGAMGLITYMRTDSTRVSEEALVEVREHIAERYGTQHLPAKANRFRTKKGAQDAHEAIRPTYLDLPPDRARPFLSQDELKLYSVIWDRFVASQMKPARFDVTQADVENGAYVLRATGRVLRDPGFLAVYQEAPEEGANGNGNQQKSTPLPDLEEGGELKLLEILSEQKFTQPPPAFSEATLVKALEENGIGRPSTYASILSTLTDRDYAVKAQRRFRPTALGNLVNRLLQEGFADIISESYTAQLEKQLDRIEAGDLAWKGILSAFDKKLTKDLESADKELPNVRKEGLPTEEKCPDCGSGLVIRFGRFGTFLGCSGFPDCPYTRDLEETGEGEEKGKEAGEGADEDVPPCEKCGKPMLQRRSRFGVFFGCSGYPECKNIRKTGPPRAEPKPTNVPCPECGQGEIQEKRSRRGKLFFSCGRYPDCKFALWNRPVPIPCPQCSKPFLLEKTTKKNGAQHVCSDKECGYTVSVEDGETKAEGK